MSFAHLKVPLTRTLAEIANEYSTLHLESSDLESSVDTQYSVYPVLALSRKDHKSTIPQPQPHPLYQTLADILFTPPDLFLSLTDYRIPPPPLSIAWHPRLPVIAIAQSTSASLFLYDLRTSAYLPSALTLDSITTIAFSSKNTIAAALESGIVTLSTVNLKSNLIQYPLQIILNKQSLGNLVGRINSLDFDNSARFLAIATSKSGLWIHDLLYQHSFRLCTHPTSSVHWSSGNFIAVSTKSAIFVYAYIHSGTGLAFSSPLRITLSPLRIAPPSKSPKLNQVQWHADGKTLFYTLIDQPDVRIAFLYPSSIPGETPAYIHQPSIPTPFTSSGLMTYGGPISSIALDPTAERLVVSFTTSNLLASFFIRTQSSASTTDISIPLGLIRGPDSPDNVPPVAIKFAGKFSRGAMLATVWEDSTVMFTPMYFLSPQTAFGGDRIGDRIWR
ncbi:Aladin [Neolecta irregularis DAH-3]|uniref:Aladin n=1 Tax=Neolecta irregularis (strain DAH-3) TaxID=1198029 RepID=A0A1U7LPT1_NEOID|nr:Aladin [Neolecta irregularis DAH-3]|eukprot:OLL24593.1 Aladin [Neolecta irregularis DAH-3]